MHINAPSAKKHLQWPRSVSLVVLVFTVALLSPAQEKPTIRTQSNVVLVPVLVRDRSGNIIYGLKPDDFIIEDDGVPQIVHLDEAAESEPISLVVAVQVGRRADFELPRMRGLSTMLDPLFEQPGSEVVLLAFDSKVHPVETFTSDDVTMALDLANLRPGAMVELLFSMRSMTPQSCLMACPKNRKRVLLLLSEIRDHGSQSATTDGMIKAHVTRSDANSWAARCGDWAVWEARAGGVRSRRTARRTGCDLPECDRFGGHPVNPLLFRLSTGVAQGRVSKKANVFYTSGTVMPAIP